MKKRWLTIIAFIALTCAALFVACGDADKYPITVEGVQNGLVALSQSEAEAGERITVTCTPDEGFLYKEGSLKVNGEIVDGMSFVMPDEPVTVTALFLSGDYTGTYLYSQKASGGEYEYGVIHMEESTLTVGATLAGFDFVFYEDVPYEFDNFTVTATVNGEAWTAEIGNGVVYSGGKEYRKSQTAEQAFVGTFTEIQEQNGWQNGYIERDFTYSEEKLVVTTYSDDGSEEKSEMPCKVFGNFVCIDETSYIRLWDSAVEKQLKYGFLEDFGGYYGFSYNQYRLRDGEAVFRDNEMLYPKRGEEVALRSDGAYILQGAFNPLNGESWGEPECYDFIALSDGKLAFSRHGSNSNGRLHYFGEDTAFVRFGNVLKISYSIDDRDYNFRFHMIDGNTILLKDTANSVKKFVFTKNIDFASAYGEPLTNEEATVYDSRYYSEGKYGDKYYDKETDVFVREEERGTYKIYGDLLVADGGALNGGITIGRVTEAEPTEENYGCDYIVEPINGFYRNGICGGKPNVKLLFWRSEQGWLQFV